MTRLQKYALWIFVGELALAAVILAATFVPLPGRVAFRIVQSGSMEPTIHVGSVVVVAPAASYEVGDIITFANKGPHALPTTHRVASMDHDNGSVHYHTKGDANEEADPTAVVHSAVVGKVAFSIPRIGYVLDFARSRTGFLALIAIPAGLVMLDEILNIIAALAAGARRRAVYAPAPARTSTRTATAVPVPHAAQPTTQQPQRTPHTSYPSDGIRPIVRPRRAPDPTPALAEHVRAGIDGCRLVLRPTY